MNRFAVIVGSMLVLLVLAASTLFIVDQRQVAVVYALGEIKEVITEPGLKMKLPPPLQNVVFLDRRIQTLDSPEAKSIFTAEKKTLAIDWLVKWRIADSRQFIRNNGVDIRNLEARLSPVVHAALLSRSDRLALPVAHEHTTCAMSARQSSSTPGFESRPRMSIGTEKPLG